MTFEVKYRNKSGDVDYINIDAPDRAGVFAVLKERGISAIQVTEGAGKKKARKAASSGAPMSGAFKGIMALVAVCVIGAVAYLFVSQDAPKPAVKEKKVEKRAIEEVVPEIVERPDVEEVKVEEVVKPEIPISNVITARTARTGRVMTLMDGTVVTNMPRPIFKRDFERALMVALRPGGMTRGIFTVVQNKYSDEQILQMLKEMTIPDPDDDDDIKACKNNVQALKERMLIAISEGRTVSDVMYEIRTQGAEENMLRVMAMKARAEAVRSGDAEFVNKTMEVVNNALEKKGLRPLDTPAAYRMTESENNEENFDDTEY